MNREIVRLVTVSLTCTSCSQEAAIHEFGQIWVSDPQIKGSYLQIDVINNTGRDLCYFQDALFYGAGAIEGSSGRTEIYRPEGDLIPMKEIELQNTGFVATELRQLNDGRGKAHLRLDRGEIDAGDDLTFDLFYCKADENNLHRIFNYQSRLR